MVSGGQKLIETLHRQGVRRVFCVAGESYLYALDAFLDYPDIQVITCRHESGAAFMAESYAHLTGRPGIVFVTRGPGACNASIGIHAGKQSSAPMIMFVGLVSLRDEGKEAFQEFDLPQMFGSHTKWAVVIRSADDIAEYTAKAFVTAQSERAGPVVLGLPEEVLSDPVQPRDAEDTAPIQHAARPQDVQAVKSALQAAQNPLVILGGSGWNDALCHTFEDWARAAGVPVAASFRRQDLFDHSHENYVGELGFGPNPALIEYVKRADSVFIFGARISEVMTQEYSLFEERQKLIHVYPSAAEIGKAYPADMAVVAGTESFITALSGLKIERQDGWAGWLARGRRNYAAWTEIGEREQGWDGADMTQIFRQIRDMLPKDAIVTGDAGNFSGWVNRYLRYGRPGRLIAPQSGSMGYGVPAAVGAAIECPDRVVVGFCGDGGFMMSSQELATAIHHGAKPVIIVCNNNMYGTIRMHQEKHFPGRVSATSLTNPDFVKLAESYGAFAARVERAGDFAAIFRAALDSGMAALIEIKQDPRQITTQSVL